MPVHHAGPTEGYIDGSDGESDILIMEQGARQRSRHGVGDSDDEAQQRITLSGGMNDALEGLTRCAALHSIHLVPISKTSEYVH
jgi:hypothetical protein